MIYHLKMNKMKRIFIFDVDNTIDLITNSSSELFVLNGETKKDVIDLIESTYPNYLSEYEEVKSLHELSEDEFSVYLDYAYWSWRDELILSRKFDIVPEVLYENYSEKDNSKYWYGRLSKEGMRQIADKLTKENGKMFFLFSIDENPDWERQEDLMGIASRYHLG